MEKNLIIKVQVKLILNLIKEIAPGRRVELRIPPYGVIQCVEGGNHRRGTPPNTVEMSGQTLVLLANNPGNWVEFVESGKVLASGSNSNLSNLLIKVSEVMKRN